MPGMASADCRPHSFNANQKAAESNFSAALSPRSPLSPRSLNNFTSVGRAEIVNAEEAEREAADAAFQAEAEAFANKYNVHALAVQRLVEDLVEEEESEAAKDDTGKPADSTPIQMSGESNKESTNPSKDSTIPLYSKITKSQTNKRHSHTQNVKNSQSGRISDQLSPLYKGRMHPITNKALGKTGAEMVNGLEHDRMSMKSGTSGSVKSSHLNSLKPLKISVSSSPAVNSPSGLLKTPNSKNYSRVLDSNNKHSPKRASSGRNLDRKPAHKAEQSTPMLETDKVQQRVKEFFQRRKSAISLGIRKGIRDDESTTLSEQSSMLAQENPDLGPFLLKLAKQAVASGDSPQKALDFATRAAKSYEVAADGKPSLDLVMSLHVLAAIHCSMGRFEEAIPILEQSITVPDVELGGQEHALAAFAGYMQLGDTYALLGKGEDALAAYHAGLEIQMGTLGDRDPRVGETCRYLAEAHAQAMQFDKAEELCEHALEIHKEHSAPATMEEATDRRLMGLICNGRGKHESALEHLVLASMALITNGKDVEVAAVDASIGDTYVALGRFDEAIFSYQKALTVFKASKGENHAQVASVYVALAELYLKTGKLHESRTYCESALRIYNKHGAGHQLDEVASGMTEIALVYEALDEHEQALSLLEKARTILEVAPGQQTAVAGVEAQIGVLNYLSGKYADARFSFENAVSKLRASAERNFCLLGIVLNQMGLTCVQLSEIEAAVSCFEESREILQTACGPYHPDTISVYSNLAGAYDALGRLEDAIRVLEYILEVREEKLGNADPDVEEERIRLAGLLKEAGRVRTRRLNGTLDSIMQPNVAPVLGGDANGTEVRAAV